jgi:hypothetical protein
MAMRVTFNGDQAGAKFTRVVSRWKAGTLKAARDTADEIAQQIQEEGRADIASAGNFSSRWINAFNTRVGEGGGNIRISVTMGGEPPVSYWRVFQYGAVINGKPLLWIPLSFASDAKGVNARDYGGQLFRVDRVGKAPLLMTKEGAKYFGKESVTIPKKFNLIEIATAGARALGSVFRTFLRRETGG